MQGNPRRGKKLIKKQYAQFLKLALASIVLVKLALSSIVLVKLALASIVSGENKDYQNISIRSVSDPKL